MAVSGLGCRKDLVGTEWVISLLLCTNGVCTYPLLCRAFISGSEKVFPGLDWQTLAVSNGY